VSYKSYCGGIPAVPNDFKYKFSWSPVGVIKALNSPAKFTQNFEEKLVPQPYKEVKNHLINSESFEAYPNRDSLPYIEEYLFSPEWKIKEFVRGTLRLNGWTLAWREIFNMLEKQDANIEEQIFESSMYIRFSKQNLVKKILTLEEKDPIRIAIYTPTYVKKEIPDTYRKLLNQNND